jgi:hypothetical protein
MAEMQSESDSPWQPRPEPLDADFLDEVESDSYKTLVREDFAAMDWYLSGDLTDEQRAAISRCQTLIRPLLARDRLTFGDCDIIDGVVDRMGEIGCPIID